MQFVKLTQKELLALKHKEGQSEQALVLKIKSNVLEPRGWAVVVRLTQCYCTEHNKQEQFLMSFNRNFASWHLDSEEIEEAHKIIL